MKTRYSNQGFDFWSGVIATILAACSGLVGIALILFDRDIGLEIALAYWSIVIALFMSFLFTHITRTEAQSERILNQPHPGIEEFHDSDAFIECLADTTVGAETVCTINFSPARGTSPKLDKYFAKLHDYLKNDKETLRDFRSIANIESASKAEWIFDRYNELCDCSRVSQGILPSTHAERLLCFHVVTKNNNGYVFLYPPVPLTGIMDALLIKSKPAADILRKQFDFLWQECLHVNDGLVPNKEGLEFLAHQNPQIRQKSRFSELMQHAK